MLPLELLGYRLLAQQSVVSRPQTVHENQKRNGRVRFDFCVYCILHIFEYRTPLTGFSQLPSYYVIPPLRSERITGRRPGSSRWSLADLAVPTPMNMLALLRHLTTFWPDPEPTLFSGTSQHSLLTGCIVMLFQSGGSSDDIRRRADACGRNIWNRPNSFEAQEIFFEYATWSLQAHIRLCHLF